MRQHGNQRGRDLEGYQTALELGVASTFGPEEAEILLDSSVHIWSPRIQSHYENGRRSLTMARSRRLVFFTDEYPNQVRNLVENFLCSSDETDVICLIVQQVSCVLLESGDDPDVVSFTLRNGLRDSINSGEFVLAIPPEHIP